MTVRLWLADWRGPSNGSSSACRPAWWLQGGAKLPLQAAKKSFRLPITGPLQSRWRELQRLLGQKTLEAADPQEAACNTPVVQKTAGAAAARPLGRSTVRDEDRGGGDWGLPAPIPDRTGIRERVEETDWPPAVARRKSGGADIKSVIAELPSYGYSAWSTPSSSHRPPPPPRQSLSAGLKPSNHKDGFTRVMKVHACCFRSHAGCARRRHDGRISVDERNRRWCSRMALRSAGDTVRGGCGSPSRSLL